MAKERRSDDEFARAQQETRRYWLHNLSRIPDFGRIADWWGDLSRGGRWAVWFLLVALIMAAPVIGIVRALLS
jgi:hypothetical protein